MSAATPHSLPYDPATVEFDPLLRRLNLANTRRHWRQLIDRAETHGWSCREFLGVLISEEISHRLPRYPWPAGKADYKSNSSTTCSRTFWS